MITLPPCPLCHTTLTIDYDNSTKNYITSFCQNEKCMHNNQCSYTAKFINQQINYEYFILQDIIMEVFHQKEFTRLSRPQTNNQIDNQIEIEKTNPVRINKILAPNYTKAKLYLLLS